MTHRFFKFSNTNGNLYCRVLGNGEKKIIAFHGFGQDGNVYNTLNTNQSNYTIYSFDLPFHGNTNIDDATTCFRTNYLFAAVKELIKSEHIHTFSLISFSIGAKLGFLIAQRFNQLVDVAWFLAPDGLKDNFWYVLATKYGWMRRIFRFTMHKPGLLLKIGSSLNSLNLIHTKRWSFIEKTLASEAQRNRVYLTWVHLRCLGDINGKVVETFKGVKKVVFVVGEKDKVIKSEIIEKVHRKIDESSIIYLPCGHNKLINCFSDWLVRENEKL